jgi:hypothetical protein
MLQVHRNIIVFRKAIDNSSAFATAVKLARVYDYELRNCGRHTSDGMAITRLRRFNRGHYSRGASRGSRPKLLTLKIDHI